MIVLGLDASTTSTGWSVFQDRKLIGYGVIKPEGKDWRERMANQAPKIMEIIEKYSPNKIYMEDVPLKRANPTALMILGAVQGFFYGLVAKYSIPIEFIKPSAWRSPIGLYDGTKEGTKRPELKHKSILKANELFKLDLKWVSPNSKYNEDDISDAILLAYSQISSRKLKSLDK